MHRRNVQTLNGVSRFPINTSRGGCAGYQIATFDTRLCLQVPTAQWQLRARSTISILPVKPGWRRSSRIVRALSVDR